MGVNSDHFKEGRTNGHLAIVIHVEEYHIIIVKNACKYNPPVEIDAYYSTAANEIAAVRAVKEAEWKRKLTSIETFNGACAGVNDLIIYRL